MTKAFFSNLPYAVRKNNHQSTSRRSNTRGPEDKDYTAHQHPTAHYARFFATELERHDNHVLQDLLYASILGLNRIGRCDWSTMSWQDASGRIYRWLLHRSDLVAFLDFSAAQRYSSV